MFPDLESICGRTLTVSMHAVIQKVMGAESEAKGLVEAARLDAERVVADARSRAKECLEQARQQVRFEAQGIVEAAVRAAEGEKQACLASEIAEIQAHVRLDEGTKEQAVSAVVRCVCGEGRGSQEPLCRETE